MKWVHRGEEVVQQYKNFVLDLCSAHNYYTLFTLKQLVSTFLEGSLNSIRCYFHMFLFLKILSDCS